jgi:MSHA biogenesis protein MshM
MYLEHFGLDEPPFTLTPDTGFFFNNGSHQEALNVLLVALRSGEGFIRVTGEVGTGKTLLCRKLLNTLGDDMVTAYIPNPFLNPTALRMALAEELGLEFARNIGQHRLLGLITDRLVELNSADKQVVLLLDEAQAIPDDSLEALRLLTNLETEKTKLLQVILFGQPELNVRLEQRHLRQLRQRIVFSYELRPLDRESLCAYLTHRLLVAGYRGGPLFTDKAVKRLHSASRGIPRLVNILCHKALLAAFGTGDPRVDHHHIRRAANDTEDARPLGRLRRLWPRGRWLHAAALAGASLSLGWSLWS